MNQQKYVLPQGFPEIDRGHPQVHHSQLQVIQTQPMAGQYQQPLMAPPMSVHQQSTTVTQQQGRRNRVSREWTTGLMDCCSDMGSCYGVCCCPVCYLMVLSTEMDENCCVPCIVPCPWLVLRVKVRFMDKIKGSIIKDCLVSTCCCPCVICQIKREWLNMQKIKSSANNNGGVF